jgi:hypothetical protein
MFSLSVTSCSTNAKRHFRISSNELKLNSNTPLDVSSTNAAKHVRKMEGSVSVLTGLRSRFQRSTNKRDVARTIRQTRFEISTRKASITLAYHPHWYCCVSPKMPNSRSVAIALTDRHFYATQADAARRLICSACGQSEAILCPRQ